jgi:hypothetical protein
VRTVGEYLERWGYTAKKPSRHSRDQGTGPADHVIDKFCKL